MSYWKKELPPDEGWWWVKYRGKYGDVICPAQVTILRTGTVVNTARNDVFTFRPGDTVNDIQFGEQISYPEGK